MKSSSKPTDGDKRVLIGRVTGAHGIHGALKIQSFAESMEWYRTGSSIRVDRPDGSGETMIVDWVSAYGRGLRLGFESVNDRNQAEHLIGSSLYIEQSRLPALEQDTYYWHELIGLRVYDTTGFPLGRLDEIIPTPGNDVYVVNGQVDGRSRELLIPAIGRVVRTIDLERGAMIVDPPQGL